MKAVTEIPIFVLGTVLFPGGVLPLRVFEARYVDMIRDCLRTKTGFGVCLLSEGREVGAPARHAEAGCHARIADFDMDQPGLLQVRALGGARFRVLERGLRPSGLAMATVQDLEPDAPTAIPEELLGCRALLKRIVQERQEENLPAMQRLFEGPWLWDDAGWLANRLSEFLPVPASARQGLMMLEDPVARLTLVHQVLARQGLV